MQASNLASATAEFDFVVDEAQQRAFAELSGDYNPLHLDMEFARGLGFVGPVVYGGMIVAQVSRLIGMELPGSAAVWSALKIDFRAPLYVGEAAHIAAEVAHYSEAARTLSIKIKVNSGSCLIATATALATLRDDVTELIPDLSGR